MHRCRLVASVLWVFLSVMGCSSDEGESQIPPSRRPVRKSLNPNEVIQQLLADAKTAEPEIAALRKSRFAISEATEIPAGRDRYDNQAFLKQYRDFRWREYQSHWSQSKDPEAAKPLVELFFKEIADWQSIRPDIEVGQILALGKSAVLAGSKDVWVEGFIACLMPVPETPTEMETYRKNLEDSWNKMPPEDYGSILSVVLAQRILKADGILKEGLKRVPSMEQEGHRKEYLGTMVTYLERFPNAEDWRFAQQVVDVLQEWQSDKERDAMRREVLSSPNIVPWYKLIAACRILRLEAWAARGQGTGDTVSEVGWKVFQDKTNQECQLNLLQWQLKPEYPEAAAIMIEMANLGGEREWSPRQWFQQSIDAQCDFSSAYDAYRRSLQPRWGGSHASLIQFAEECVMTKRTDTQIPHLGLKALELVQDELGTERSVVSNPSAQKTISSYASQTILATKNKEPVTRHRETWAGEVLHWLVVAGDYPLARNWLENCGVEITPASLQYSRDRLSRMKQTIAACTGPASDVAIPLVKAIYGPKIPTAEQLPALRESLATLRERDASELTMALVKEIELVLNQYESFQAGEWTEFGFDKIMTGWRFAIADELQPIDESTLTMHGQGLSLASPVARFKPPYMLEVEVQHHAPPGITPTSLGGLLVGIESFDGTYLGPEVFPSTVIQPDLNVVVNLGVGNGLMLPLVPAKSHQLRMTVWPGEVDALVDGIIFSQHEISQDFPTRLGLGRGREFQGPTALRFHRFRIRKIPYAEVIPVPVKEMDTYGQTVIDFDPEGPEGYFYKVQGLIAEGQFTEAIATLEAGIPRVPHPAGLYTQLASLHFFEENYSEAERLCREVLKTAPMPRESAYLAIILAAAPDPKMRRLEEALQYTGSVRADADWMGACALATVQAAKGDLESAKRSIEPAEMLAPDDRAKAFVRHISEAIQRGEVPVLPTKNPAQGSPGTPRVEPDRPGEASGSPANTSTTP